MPRPIPSHLRRSFKKERFYKHLVRSVERRFEKWRHRYANIVGVNITKKTRSKKEINRYAIVFHVSKKDDSISGSRRIPQYLEVIYNGQMIRVPTDVVETGYNELTYIHPGQNGFEEDNVDAAGTLGPVVNKNNEPYILSNMHVFGRHYLLEGRRSVTKNVGSGSQVDINCLVNNGIRPVGIFQVGVVNSQIDAAIAYVPPGLRQYLRRMDDVFDINNPIIVPNEVIKNPFTVQMIGSVSGIKRSHVVSGIGIAIFEYPYGTQTIFKMIQLSPCCNVPGDSGSPIFDPISRRIVGIVLGRDFNQRFTYVVPYQTIRTQLIID